ncbi:MAG: hypothetical protein JO086_06945 [Acidimicrobiia bacterium]|nr:hypothetical protein [Acidimicrobiia bacterium]
MPRCNAFLVDGSGRRCSLSTEHPSGRCGKHRTAAGAPTATSSVAAAAAFEASTGRRKALPGVAEVLSRSWPDTSFSAVGDTVAWSDGPTVAQVAARTSVLGPAAPRHWARTPTPHARAAALLDWFAAASPRGRPLTSDVTEARAWAARALKVVDGALRVTPYPEKAFVDSWDRARRLVAEDPTASARDIAVRLALEGRPS